MKIDRVNREKSAEKIAMEINKLMKGNLYGNDFLSAISL